MHFIILSLLIALLAVSYAAPGPRPGPSPYMIGGSEVSFIHYWPWQGSLHHRFGSFANCGVVMIAKNWALTAARCFEGELPYEVRFGSVQRSLYGKLLPVLEIIVHENYTKGRSGYSNYTHQNDIALVRFPGVTFGDTINKVTLGTEEEYRNNHCYSTGWGWAYNTLHQGKATITTETACKGDYYNVDAGHVCTKGNSMAVCRGDFGGPLVCWRDGEYQLVGISSFNMGDNNSCTNTWHSVFSRISHYKTWIEGKISQRT